MCLETFWRNGRWHVLFPHSLCSDRLEIEMRPLGCNAARPLDLPAYAPHRRTTRGAKSPDGDAESLARERR